MNRLVVSPEWDLPTLNVFIAQQENFLRGQLIAIGTDGSQTMLSFDDESGNKPVSNTVVTISGPPTGATVVATGNIYIRNKSVLAIAYRG
jgi:hypothetical protein